MQDSDTPRFTPPADGRIGQRYLLTTPLGPPDRPGNTWSAQDEETGRPVAIKLLGLLPDPPDLAVLSAELVGWLGTAPPGFLGYAELLVQEVPEGFLVAGVRDLVAGETLAQRLARRGALAREEVLDLGDRLLERVAALIRHDPPLVHGDLNPENVFYGSDGGLVVVDPGQPKAVVRSVASMSGGGWGLAVEGEYSAPEILLGAPNSRSDLYGVGALAALAGTGQRPYAWKRKPAAALEALVAGGMGRNLPEAVARLMAPTQENRFGTADEARSALHRPDKTLAQEVSAAWHVTPEPGLAWRWTGIIAAVALVPAVLLGVVGLVLLGRGDLASVTGGGLALLAGGAFAIRLMLEFVTLPWRPLVLDGSTLTVGAGSGAYRVDMQVVTSVQPRGPFLAVTRAGLGRGRLTLLAPVYPEALPEVANRLRAAMARDLPRDEARPALVQQPWFQAAAVLGVGLVAVLVGLLIGRPPEPAPVVAHPVATAPPAAEAPPVATTALPAMAPASAVEEVPLPAPSCPEGMASVAPADGAPAACMDHHGAMVRVADRKGTFFIDRTEVTVEAWGRCTATGECRTAGRHPSCNVAHADRSLHPMDCVNLDQAGRYCAWTGRRLCTSSEWERALGWPRQTNPWGEAPVDCTRAVLDDGSGPGCGTGRSAEVGSRPSGAAPSGAVDLVGNAAEWTANGIFGGSFATPTMGYRFDGDSGAIPARTEPGLGFRCCRDDAGPDPVPPAAPPPDAGHPAEG